MPSCTGGEIHLQHYSAQRKDVWLCFPLVTGPSNCIFLKAKRNRCLVWVPGMHTVGSRHTERSRKPNLKTALCALFCAVWLLYSCTHILKNNFWNSLFFFSGPGSAGKWKRSQVAVSVIIFLENPIVIWKENCMRWLRILKGNSSKITFFV